MADLLPDEGVVVKTISDTPPTHYTVKLQGFSSFTKNNIERYSSAEFAAGVYRWKLIVHPNGNKSRNINDNISVYLTLVESSLPHPWSEVHAVFRVFLHDQNKDKYYTLGVANGRRFHKMKLEWGFDQFMPLKAFIDPSKGYLVNDTCAFGAEVYICKENNTGKGEKLVMINGGNTFKYPWKLERFSSIATKGVHDSAIFNGGDQKWKIQTYPRGTVSEPGVYLSLYLSLADPSSLSTGSQIYVEYTLRILNQKHGKNHAFKGNNWFSAAASSFGWARFISLSNFTQSDSGFLVKDNCTIEAEVTVHGTTTAL